MASRIFSSEEFIKSVIALDFKIDVDSQYDILFHIRNLINLSTRWFLRNHYVHRHIENTIDLFQNGVKTLTKWVPILMGGYTRQYLTDITSQFVTMGLPEGLAEKIGTYRAIYSTLNIMDLAKNHQYDLVETAKIYFAAGEKMNLIWFRDQIAQDKREGHWSALARLTLRDDLDIAQRQLTLAIMQSEHKSKEPTERIEQWMLSNKIHLARWDNVLSHLHSSTSHDYSMFFIVIRELLDIIETTIHNTVPKKTKQTRVAK